MKRAVTIIGGPYDGTVVNAPPVGMLNLDCSYCKQQPWPEHRESVTLPIQRDQFGNCHVVWPEGLDL